MSRVILEAGKAQSEYWKDLWRYRDLFVVLAWRDVSVRYKQTFMGLAWAIIRPLLTTMVFVIIFNKVAQLPSTGEAPYTLLVFSAMLPWSLFSAILSDGSNSLVGNSHLIGKVYFPRLIIPSAYIIVSLIDFAISFMLFGALCVWFDFVPNWRIIFVPLLIIWCVVAAMGPALLLSSLNVKYRDVRFLVPFVLQLGLYVSPVGFSAAAVPPEYRLLFDMNPMVGIIESFRWCLLGPQNGSSLQEAITLGLFVTVGLFLLGLAYFRKTERTLADVI